MADQLKQMKYAELRKIAKKYGIKANMKTEKLIVAISAKMNEDNSTEFAGSDTEAQALETSQCSPNHLHHKQSNELSSPTGSSRTSHGSPKTPADSDEEPLDLESSTSEEMTRWNSVDEEVSMRRRSSVDDEVVINTQRIQSSARVEELLASMQDDMTDSEMKESLIGALEKNVDNRKIVSGDKLKKSQIPRFSSQLQKVKKVDKTSNSVNTTKTVTPGNKNWKRIHEKAFSKMDSIDVYLDKKRKRYSSAQKSTPLKDAGNTPNRQQSALSSKRVLSLEDEKPSVVSKGSKSKLTITLSTKSDVTRTPKPFAPSVTNTSAINLSFAGANATFSFSARKTRNSADKNLNTTCGGSSKKFDLAVSLSKPLKYKPHTGKLAPFKLENIYTKKTTVPVKSSEQRREIDLKKKASTRKDNMLARRGIKI